MDLLRYVSIAPNNMVVVPPHRVYSNYVKNIIRLKFSIVSLISFYITWLTFYAIKFWKWSTRSYRGTEIFFFEAHLIILIDQPIFFLFYFSFLHSRWVTKEKQPWQPYPKYIAINNVTLLSKLKQLYVYFLYISRENQ